MSLIAAVVSAAPPPAPATRMARISVRPIGGQSAPRTFRVVLGRTKVPVVRTLTPADPQMILVVLDLTGDSALIESARAALAGTIERLPAATRVALLRAQDGLTVLADPGANRAPVLQAIRDVSIGGRPGLLETVDAVAQLADSIARAAQVRLAVLYVTDSDVTRYREDLSNPVINSSDPHDLSRKFPETLVQEKMSKLSAHLASRQTPLHVVHLAYRADRLNEAYQNGLTQVTTMLGGAAEFCRSQGEIAEAVERQFAEIASGFTLLVAVPSHAPGSLPVEVSAGDTRLVYRARLELKEKR